jgi:hypothetical protein
MLSKKVVVEQDELTNEVDEMSTMLGSAIF